MFRLFIALLLVAHTVVAAGQGRFTLSGYVTDASNGEDLIGATLFCKEAALGAATNEYGFYSLTLPAGKYTLIVQYIGFETKTIEIDLHADQKLNIELTSNAEEIETVEVTAERISNNIEDVQMSRIDLPIHTIRKIPAVFGEIDPIKALQLLPGITSGGEGIGGFFVRGGGIDQNLIILDEAPIYNASHLLGFFSVFNPDAINDMKIYKGGIPAEYGGRLSSLLDIRMKEGNAKKFSVSGGLGIISSRLTIEAPIVKEKLSFMVSGRRTYADLFFKLSTDTTINRQVLFFYDLNTKINYKINDKNRLFITGYFGRDVLEFAEEFFTNWGNQTATVRWNHLFSNKMFANFSFIYSRFDYSLGDPDGNDGFDWTSGIRDLGAKISFTQYVNPKNTLKFGVEATHHSFNPGLITPTGDSSEVIFEEFIIPEKNSIELAAYISNELKINKQWSVNFGLRYSAFMQIGPGQVFEYDENFDQPIDTTFYDPWKFIVGYHGPEPRAGVRYAMNENNALKASYNRTRQYLHLINNATISSPLDIWVPSDTYIPAQRADQWAIGYFRNFKQNMYEASVEVYYKSMRDVVDYIDNAELVLNDKLETQLLRGSAWSFGAEFLIRKQTGRLTGWISYTLSRTRQKVPGINNGESYPAPYDRTHDISIVSNFQINDRWDISGTWIYSTGLATTFPAAGFRFGSIRAPVFTSRNGFRIPAYHRLDIAANYKLKHKPDSRYRHELNFSVYNAYYRKNVFSYRFSTDNRRAGNVEVQKRYLFTIIPSITYNFKF